MKAEVYYMCQECSSKNTWAEKYIQTKHQKDNAYTERNHLVALLAALYPSGKAKTDIPDWDSEWHNCIYIDFPWGQASWHVHDSDMYLFEHVPQYEKKWDGHTTEEKYRKIEEAIKLVGKNSKLLISHKEKM